MLWHNIKPIVHAWENSNVIKLKQFCNEGQNSSAATWKIDLKKSKVTVVIVAENNSLACINFSLKKWADEKCVGLI